MSIKGYERFYLSTVFTYVQWKSFRLHLIRRKGTLIYNLINFKALIAICSLASAHPKGLIELKTQGVLHIYN